jgi:hypothetical protein
MRIWRGVLIAMACVALGYAFGRMQPAAAVHAQDKYAIPGGCIADVPRSWGTFKGASDYGLAFEDNDGTVRFLQHLPCGNGLSSMDSPSVAVDLKVDRR